MDLLKGNNSEEIREVKLPEDEGLLEKFLMQDQIEFIHLLLALREKCFHKSYARFSEDIIKTLVTIDRFITVHKGDERFVNPILEKWGPSRGSFSMQLKHLHALLRIYKPLKPFDEIFAMFVDREHFLNKSKYKAERLSSKDLPKPWTKDFKGIAYGIRANNKIVSIGSVSGLVDGIGYTSSAIKTDLEYRNRGYATSTLSHAVQDALKIVPIVIYLVKSNNIPAIRVLEKLGYRFYSSFLFTEMERRT